MNFAYLAQYLVDATSQLMRGRPINLMDCEGVIIASTQKERIGVFHAGAAEAIRTGKPVRIEKNDLAQYPGSREGYNMPIFDDDRIIGVVGIYGNPQEVEDLGNLLRVYVTQFMQQDLLSRKTIFRKELYAQMIRLLVTGKEEDMREIRHLCSSGEIHLQFPMKIYYFYRNDARIQDREPSYDRGYQELEQQLLWKNRINRGCDIYGAYDRGFLWFHSFGKAYAKECVEINGFIQENQEYTVAGSRICKGLSTMHACFQEMVLFIEKIRETAVEYGSFYDLEMPSCQQENCMFHLSEQYGKAYAEELYAGLTASADAGTIEVLLVTALVYFEEEGSVTKAAERLQLHKNTLLYRLNRLYGYLKLEQESAFTKEFFIRMILSLHPVVIPKGVCKTRG